ncbi:MAG TPA: pitrilysin family protein [Gemmatimonadaceae bacterium]|nr:pitrilysin family protein [Gemmatimonadaceae bacterium]
MTSTLSDNSPVMRAMRPRSRRCRRAATAATAMLLLLAACEPRSAALESDLTQPPPLDEPADLTLPTPVTRDLDNGLRVVVVEHHELPLVDVQLLIASGGEADPADRLGLASFTASALMEGAGDRSSLEIADQEAYLGVSLRTNARFEQSLIALHTPTAQLDSALALFADVALRPTFPAAEIDRLRQTRLTGLLQLRDRGPAIADRAYARILFGNEHPYGRPLGGDEAGTAALTADDVRTFYETYYRPNNATLLVVGDVDPADVERRANAIFGAWARDTVPAVAYPSPAESRPTTIYLIDKPGAAQSSFRIGLVGVPRSTPDFFAIEVMNTVLGVPFTSRLNNNLRETRGYTYGARSRFDMRRSAGPFTASAEIVAAKSDSALIEFMKELNAIRDTVPADELLKARRYLRNQMPAAFETTGDIAGQLSELIQYDLPLDFYNGYSQGIAAVTQADVQRVAQQYIDPGHLAIVIVGDRKLIEPGLRALGMAPVVEETLQSAAP